MKLGLQIPIFTWPGGARVLGTKLADIVRTADDAGYASIWVMDHHFQIEMVGRAEMDMLEAYTALGYIAAHTSKARLGTMVTGVTYRHPGILAKQVTTLDVLSGGRAYLGIGAAWFEREHVGLGVPFPPFKERFERLEEALQIAKQMWSDNDGPFRGKHYQLAETLNSPQVLSKPHPPILIGGAGEKKTLRLVAKYGDACNIFAPSPAFVAQKLAVLQQHCEAVGPQLRRHREDDHSANGSRRRREQNCSGSGCVRRDRRNALPGSLGERRENRTAGGCGARRVAAGREAVKPP